MHFAVGPLTHSLQFSLSCLSIICEFIPIHASSNERNQIMASITALNVNWIWPHHLVLCEIIMAIISPIFVCLVAGPKKLLLLLLEMLKKTPTTNKTPKPIICFS